MFSSDKIDNHEYLKSEEMLPTDQNRLIIQAEFTHYLLNFFYHMKKHLKKTPKTIEKHGEETNKGLKGLKQRNKQRSRRKTISSFATFSEKELPFVTHFISN